MYEAALSAYEDDRGAGSADRLGAQAKQRLRLAIDQVKIDLSGADSVTLSVDMGAASLLLLTQDSDLNTTRTIMVLPLHVQLRAYLKIVCASYAMHQIDDDKAPFEQLWTREFFEETCSELFAKVLPPVERCLESAAVPAGAVGDIVLVGGSTRTSLLSCRNKNSICTAQRTLLGTLFNSLFCSFVCGSRNCWCHS